MSLLLSGVGRANAAAADGTAPTLSSPTATATGATTADLGVTTDEGNGTLYWVVTTSSTAPSAAQVKAGQDNSGSAAADSGSESVGSTGSQSASATGLTASTSYTAHFMHEDAAANQSSVASSAEFTTDAASSGITVTYQDDDLNTSGLTTYTFSSMSFGATGAGRLLKIGVVANGTNAVSSLTAGGVSGTKAASIDGESNKTLAIFTVPNTDDASGDVVVTFAAAMLRCAVVVWSSEGNDSATPNDTLSSLEAEPNTGTIDILDGGAAVGLVVDSINGTGTYTWTGLDTEDVDAVIAGSRQWGAAHQDEMTAETGRTISVASSGSSTSTSMLVAAWGP